MKRIIETVGFIHIKNRKLLLVRPFNKKIFYMPGGKKDKGENNIGALIREVKEELGVEVSPGKVEYYGVFEAQAYGKDEGVIVKIHCFTADHSGVIESKSEIEEIAFFSHDEYLRRSEVAPAVKLIIKDLKRKGFID